MTEQTALTLERTRPPAPRVRDFLLILFRRRKLIVRSFLGTLVGATLAILLIPDKYEAQLKIMVKRYRSDAVLTPASNATGPIRATSEEEVNSEVDLLKSRDLLQQVVVNTGLDAKIKTMWPLSYFIKEGEKNDKIGQAVQGLERGVVVQPPKKSNLITLTYQSSDPQLAAKVLNTLGDVYLQKHLEVHRITGTVDFFQKEAQQYRSGLENAENKLADFSKQEGVISAQFEKDQTLAKLTQFEAEAQETQTAIASIEERIRILQQQLAATPPRTTTQIRTSSTTLQQLKSTLFQLELKRTELLGKFEPSYRPVQDVERQIASTKAAIAEAESQPLHEQTTDENPVYQWIRSELAKCNSELGSLRARATATQRSIQTYRAKALQLEQKGIQQQELLRSAKTAEENYLLYVRKQEEARMSEALDRQRILNVAIAEAATVPTVPVTSPLMKAMLALVLSSIVSLGLAFGSDFVDPSIRTPDEAQAVLNVTVLAALPREQHLLSAGKADHSAEIANSAQAGH